MKVQTFGCCELLESFSNVYCPHCKSTRLTGTSRKAGAFHSADQMATTSKAKMQLTTSRVVPRIGEGHNA
ncbi:hypothetical protein CDAR_274841 [Caerostris darwini]|uniref:Uncharacterized protein n=1 Tax=Caerostris darwini TaxID=1538125 RepID=A0AAV4PHW1_9ARAC|nr:hypothetical protein CDAR_274841 [Caerostris darwini]